MHYLSVRVLLPEFPRIDTTCLEPLYVLVNVVPLSFKSKPIPIPRPVYLYPAPHSRASLFPWPACSGWVASFVGFTAYPWQWGRNAAVQSSANPPKPPDSLSTRNTGQHMSTFVATGNGQRFRHQMFG